MPWFWMEPNTFTLHFLCRQGFGFFLFYVVLNPEVRKLIIAAWEWKSTLVTPFDEHEAIEIEEEKVYLKIKLTVYSYQSTLSNVYI